MERFKKRREKVLSFMEDGDALLLLANPEPSSLSGATRFYQDRNFYYLTGIPEPDSACLLLPGSNKPYRLFIRERNPEEEAWTGRRMGIEGALAAGADEAHPWEALLKEVTKALKGRKRLFLAWGYQHHKDLFILHLMESLRKHYRYEDIPHTIIDAHQLLAPLRLIKDKEEIEAIKASVHIAVEAFQEVMEGVEPGMRESQVQGMLEGYFLGLGAEGMAFPSIVASGANATVLHYQDNNSIIKKGELLLIDAGCLYQHYASDLTRTFLPHQQKPTEAQKTLYDAVLTAQEEMIQKVKPGTSLAELNQQCQRRMAEVMKDLGFFKASVDEILEKSQHKTFFPHRLGHWLGLDVHDAGSYGMEDFALPLQPGMVITIEPGIYIPPNTEGAAAGFAGIGIRIEDDILVTDEGRENLSQALPKKIQGLE